MEKLGIDDCKMSLYHNRLASFNKWPFSEGDSCTPGKMAEAGFYACGDDTEPDLARCYVCRKELDGWEPHDDPWKEHESHAKGRCEFVKLKKSYTELTVKDYLNLEGEKFKNIMEKIGDAKYKEFERKAAEKRKLLENLKPLAK